ncbi:MAG: replicative DNA helicase [Chitinophagaceae bacterium]|nr:replicative DNA helicase [Chitinophagaceae bacterium]MCA6456278.1 replicative DNA helicase [Chitinophagaceae bacterium]MCA6460226.1 replicative DNA helicase [Chitinophagaceae bacterium]MCA6465113.1 replicative DNA helicase [Chitinophagaceae bacterium]MEA3427424.1 replicative DNA helicase [Bacteroidota bacterium]
MDLTSLNKDRKRRKTSIDMSTMLYGKVPPQAKELEEAVLGAVMLEKSAFDTISEIIKPECFYVEANQLIYKAMQGLQQKSMPIDILTVVEELKMREQLDAVGGPYYVTKLTNSVVSTANIEAHARIVLQKFIQRELIRISGEIIGDAYEDSTDVFDLLDESETKMFNITNNYLKKNFEDIQNVLAKTINRIDELRTKTEDISGVPSGFPTLDRITYGWQPTDLIILAARPSVGKTAFALNLARNSALHPTKPVPVGFFSLEMSASQLVQRILSAESEIKMEKISRGKLENYEYEQLLSKGIKKLEVAPIFIDDTAALNIFEFRAKARRLVNKHNVGIIIIDYLQLMSGSGDRNSNREQEISNISRNLKALAKELNVPIIALSQLSRAVETRKESKMPQLSDLRESGAIEQDADMVMFIYRPEYYEVMNNEHGESTHGETHVRIAKHRNGSLETVKLRAKLEIQKFEEWDDNGGMPGLGGSWKPVGPSVPPAAGGAGDSKLFIQKGSKMNGGDFDEGFDNDAPF